MSNKTLGNALQREFAETLWRNGYWVHLMQQSSIGQPADIIAVKQGKAHLIDCKHCSNSYFDTGRIEDNQKTAMRFWAESGNEAGWFAVKIKDKIWMATIDQLEKAPKTRLSESWFQSECISLDTWIEVFS